MHSGMSERENLDEIIKNRMTMLGVPNDAKLDDEKNSRDVDTFGYVMLNPAPDTILIKGDVVWVIWLWELIDMIHLISSFIILLKNKQNKCYSFLGFRYLLLPEISIKSPQYTKSTHTSAAAHPEDTITDDAKNSKQVSELW